MSADQTRWADMPLAAFDLETTAPDPSAARIVTACLARIDDGVPQTRQWLLDCGEIPAEATAIHHISTEHAAAHGMRYAAGVAEIRDALFRAWGDGYLVVAFNASYDMTVVHTQGLALGHAALHCGPIFDPYVVDSALTRRRGENAGSRKLTAVAAHHGVAMGDAHDATQDALAAARIAWKLRTHPGIGRWSIARLMDQQAIWYRQRQESLREYFIRTGQSTDDIDGHWPLRGVA